MSVLTNRWLILSLVENLAAQPQASVPQASGGLGYNKSHLSILEQPAEPDDIIGAHQQSTSTRLELHQAILAIFNKIYFRRLRTLSLAWSEGKSVFFESYNNTIFPLILQQ
ncbi:MAG TPA: hypothetical protein VLA84_20090 [Microcoleus sp.]|nr:hypothetical protein [Microcoleus sp.]